MNQIDLRGFDLNLLVVFEVLMAERNVTRAAARLGRTQSAVSHSLARLRSQLDDPLLVKSGRQMEPTAAALAFFEQARPILDLADGSSGEEFGDGDVREIEADRDPIGNLDGWLEHVSDVLVAI